MHNIVLLENGKILAEYSLYSVTETNGSNLQYLPVLSGAHFILFSEYFSWAGIFELAVKFI